jgi:hypothetical protein
MQHCPHCNYEVEAPQKFCTKCGGRLRTDEDFADATTRTLPLPAGTTKRMDPCAASDLKPVVEWKIAPMPDDSAGIDYYDFNVSLNNAGETIYRNYSVAVEIPKTHALIAGTNDAELPTSQDATHRLFERTQEHRNTKTLSPNMTLLMVQLTYTVTREQYKGDIAESIFVSVYANDSRLCKKEYPIAEMLNQEHRAKWLSR